MCTISAQTAAFIDAHRHEDIRRLALTYAHLKEIDMPFALQQIAGWQAAVSKIPTWAATPGLLFPMHLSVEQCSSEATARYKCQVIKQLIGRKPDTSDTVGRMDLMADLTGGMGVDFSFIAPMFVRSFYVERQPSLCQLARHNLKCLGLAGASVVEGDGMAWIQGLERADLIFIDPARRDDHGARTVGLADCTPDILPHLDTLMRVTPLLMVKLSPMLDYHLAVKQLRLPSAQVTDVHIVAVKGECKELLLVMRRTQDCPGDGGQDTLCQIHCVNDDHTFSYPYQPLSSPQPRLLDRPIEVGDHLLEPHAAIMKAGCFGQLCQRWPVASVSANSHFFISSHAIDDFPGRRFVVERVSGMGKKELRRLMDGIQKAHVKARNLMLSSDQLRRKLRIDDGGDHYIFAMKDRNDKPVVCLCHKT